MADVQEATRYVVEQLRRDADAHERGDFVAIGDGYQTLSLFDDYEQGDGYDDERYKACKRLGIAEAFWARWQDARNHKWNFYPGIVAGDWPVLARQLCSDMEAGYDATTLRTRAKVFDVRYTAPWWFHILGRVTRSHND